MLQLRAEPSVNHFRDVGTSKDSLCVDGLDLHPHLSSRVVLEIS